MDNTRRDVNIQHWIDTLRDSDAVIQHNDMGDNSSYCVLGVILEFSRNTPYTVPKLSLRERFRNRIQDMRVKLASKIVGYDIRDLTDY